MADLSGTATLEHVSSPASFEADKRPREHRFASDEVPFAMEKDAHPPAGSAQTAPLPPEEGLKGWLCVLGAFFTLFCTFGFLNAVGVFQSHYEDHQLRSYSPSQISWIFAVQLALMWAPGPLVGRLTDTYGATPVLLPCSILCVLSLCLTSLCTEYYQIFLAQGLGFGIGAGGVFTCSFICVGQWFVKRRGLAVGIASVGSSLGGVIFPLFLYKLIGEVGFDDAIRYTALMIGILLAGSFFLVRARLPPKKWDWDAKWFEPRLFMEPQFAFYSVGVFLVIWGLWIPFDFVATFGLDQRFTIEQAFSLISMINATSIPGRVLPPHIGDKIGHFNVITVCSFLSGISILTLWLPFDFHPSHAGLFIFCLVYGFVSGAFVSLVMPCVAKIGPIDTIGMRFGTFQLFNSIACLTGLPIGGAVLSLQGGSTYWGLQTFAILAMLIGSASMALSTFLLGRTRGSRKV